MGVTKLISVLRFVLLDNLLRIRQECACMIVLKDPLLITMSEYVWRFVLPLLISTGNPQTILAWKSALKPLISTLTTRPDYAWKIALSMNLPLLTD